MKRRFLSLVLVFALSLSLCTVCAGASGTSSQKLVAITFDDGPSANTSRLLDGLEARGVTATFFMNGVNGSGGVAHYASLLDRMRDDGDQLANHTYSHARFASLSASEMSSEVTRVENYLFSAMGGSYTDCVRTPGGANSAAIRSAVNAPIILWSVDPLDWKYRNADTVYNNVMSKVTDGSVILLHDLYSTSVDAALNVIDTLQQRGYEFVTVSELFRRRGVTLEAGNVYSRAPNNGVNLPGYSAPTALSYLNSDGTAYIVAFSTSDDVTLHYTTDGSVPTLASAVCTGSFAAAQDTTFLVAGFDRYGTRTPVTRFTVQAQATAAPAVQSYTDGLLALTCGTQGASIYYTTDGSDPTTSSTLYTGAFTPAVTTKCIASAPGCLTSATTVLTLTAYGDLFSDVSSSAWYYDSVGAVVHKGWMAGTGSWQFSSEVAATRAMLVTVLYRLNGQHAVSGTAAFSDVPAGTWYTDAVAWAAANGIVKGIGDGLFDPNGTLSREQMATIFCRYAAYVGQSTTARADLSGFSDAGSISSYATDAMSWCVAVGLLHGISGTELSPKGTAVRCQCAALLLRLDGLLTAG